MAALIPDNPPPPIRKCHAVDVDSFGVTALFLVLSEGVLVALDLALPVGFRRPADSPVAAVLVVDVAEVVAFGELGPFEGPWC
ncbi:hypothetical protein LTR15_012038 [Elasticomyces elasticus]|nr:hypothetical protein LTR15_012038 [Elasticomyces elasticus]